MIRFSVLNSPSHPLQVSIQNQTLKLYEDFALQKHLEDNVEKLCKLPQLIHKGEKISVIIIFCFYKYHLVNMKCHFIFPAFGYIHISHSGMVFHLKQILKKLNNCREQIERKHFKAILDHPPPKKHTCKTIFS